MDEELIAMRTMRGHHPLVIEGMGGYDSRDPLWVTQVILCLLYTSDAADD